MRRAGVVADVGAAVKVHTTCVIGALIGALVGLAAVAHAQDPTDVVALADPSGLSTLVELVSGGGLPAVLAVLGWLAGRWGGIPVAPLTITVQLSPEDRAELKRARRALEREAQDDSDDPPPRAAP